MNGMLTDNKTGNNRRRRSSGRIKPETLIIRVLVYTAIAITLAVLIGILAYILIKGIPYLNAGMFEMTYSSDNLSLMPAIINTVIMTLISLGISLPLGIFTAVYLVEYAKKGSRIVSAVRLTTETLSGIPSIVYGLFGYLFFVTAFGWGYSLLAGAFTMTIMILPVIIRTTEEALKSVPDSYREGSFGLGAGKLGTVFRVVIPSAIPGILAGVILSVGRIVGESAALIYTAGSVAAVPKSLLGSGRTLSVHMYALYSEGLHINEAYATAVVLIMIVIILNTLSSWTAKRLMKNSKTGR